MMMRTGSWATVAYEFVVRLSFLLSWVVFRTQRGHRGERDEA